MTPPSASTRNSIGPVPHNTAGQPTAALAERAWLAAGLSVNALKPGVLVFQPSGEEGHVGIYIGVDANGTGMILENSTVRRGTRITAAVNLVTVKDFGRISMIASFEKYGDKPDPNQPPVNVAGITSATTAPTGGLLSRVGEAVATGDFTRLVQSPERAAGYARDDDPLWLFSTLEPYTEVAPAAKFTSAGSRAPSLVILRNMFADQAMKSAPILGPWSVATQAYADRVARGWASLKSAYGQTESWTASYLPIYNLGNTASGAAYRWPLPGVTSINHRADSQIGAVCEIELMLTEQHEADLVFRTLGNAQRLKNISCEIWLPVSLHDKLNGGEKEVVIPAGTFLIDEVEAIGGTHHIRLRLLDQASFMNMRGVNPEEMQDTTFPAGTKLWEILEAIEKQYKIAFVAGNALSLRDMPGLQRSIGESGFSFHGQPPIDAARSIIERSAGLKMSHVFGTELFGRPTLGFLPRAVFLVHSPPSSTPFLKGFFQNMIYSKLLSPIATILGRGQAAVGEMAIFYPHTLAHDPTWIKNVADVLRTYASETPRASSWGRWVDNIQSILSVAGAGSGNAVTAALTNGKVVDSLNTLLTEWLPDNAGERVAKYLAPTFSVESLTLRTPSSSELANPVFSSAAGFTGQKARRVNAQTAARAMQVSQQSSGDFVLTTPTGPEKFSAHDSVYVHYSTQFARPQYVTPVAADSEVEEPEGTFQPMTLTLNTLPSHGVRPGMTCAVIGFGGVYDGIWTVATVNRTLGQAGDHMECVLTTSRDIFSI